MGQWIEDCRRVNSSWRVMIPSEILSHAIGLDSVFDDEAWYEQLLEDYNDRDGTDLTLEELTAQVLEYIQPELKAWDIEALTGVPPLAYEQVMWETGASWENLREALAEEGLPEELLKELDAALEQP